MGNKDIYLPKRTGVNMNAKFPISRNALENLARGESLTSDSSEINVQSYECIDCGFHTEDLEEMREHQKHGHHSLWQRIKRVLQI